MRGDRLIVAGGVVALLAVLAAGAVLVLGVGADVGCACPPGPSVGFEVAPAGNGTATVAVVHGGGERTVDAGG